MKREKLLPDGKHVVKGEVCMDKFKDYISNSFRYAFKSVRYNLKQYICFFAAVFVIQMMFWTLAIAGDSDKSNVEKVIAGNYEYHIIVQNMNADQYAILNNKVYEKSFEKYRAYEDVQFSSYTDPLGRVTYTAQVKLSDMDSASDIFVREYINPMKAAGTDFEVIHTPLETYKTDYLVGSGASGFLLMVLAAVFAALLIMALYAIRINHYRFMYGIYMTCGADSRKLFGTAVWEMQVISLLTLLPSMVCALVASACIYHAVGVRMHFTFGAIIKVILCNFLAVMAGVWLPMKHMSTKAPMTLIVARDNSNLVSSPRQSFRIFGRKMPWHYESFGMWRFRTYYIRLLLTATAFSALFLCGLYVGQMVETNMSRPLQEFTVTADEYLDDDTIRTICDTEGVDYCFWSNESNASLHRDHLLLKSSQGSAASFYTIPSDEVSGYSLAINNYRYVTFDKALLDMITEKGLYDIEGDPYAVLTQENAVILSDSLANTSCLSFKPGDKVILSDFLATNGGRIDTSVLDAKELLREQIRKFLFEYREYTVVAVIRGGEADNFFTFGVNETEYEALTGITPTRQELEVYVTPESSLETIQAAYESIRAEMTLTVGGRVTQHNAHLQNELQGMKNIRARVILLAALVLLVCPMVWFFSQVIFFGKRKQEMDVLRSFGAIEKEIFGVHAVSGGYTAVFSVIVTLALAYFTSGLLFLFCNRLMSALGFGSGTRYAFYMSVPALVCCIAISMLCGFLSAVVPYLVYRQKKIKERITGVVENPNTIST